MMGKGRFCSFCGLVVLLDMPPNDNKSQNLNRILPYLYPRKSFFTFSDKIFSAMRLPSTPFALAASHAIPSAKDVFAYAKIIECITGGEYVKGNCDGKFFVWRCFDLPVVC